MSDEEKHGASRRQFIGWTGVAGGAALFNAMGPAASDPALFDALADRVDPDVTEGLFDISGTIRRPDDQLLLNFEISNCQADFTNNPPTLSRISTVLSSFLTVTFGTIDSPTPMHVAEEAFTRNDSNLPHQPNAPVPPGSGTSVDAPPVRSRISGGTRLVFQIPDAMMTDGSDTQLTLTTDSLLNWIAMRLSVANNAVPPFTDTSNPPNALIGAPREPFNSETAIELPYNLIVSPPATYSPSPTPPPQARTIFVNATARVTHNHWTELWHTRLAALTPVGGIDNLIVFLPNETIREVRTIRAIWCTDKKANSDSRFEADLNANVSSPGDDGDPFGTSKKKALEYGDRYDIVRLSSDFTPDSQGGPYKRTPSTDPNAPKDERHKPATPFIPSPATVDRLMLTSLGAWLDCDAHWDLPHYQAGGSKPGTGYSSSLLAWRNRTVQARDTYVRIVRKGYLFPWGHKASLVTVTEREFTPNSGSVGAYLRQKTFIVVVEPTKNYDHSDSIMHNGRKLPFTDVQILTHVTPDLDAPVRWAGTTQGTGHDELVFQPTVGGKHPPVPYEFHMRGTDWNGDQIDFHSPVLWMDDTIAYNDSSVSVPGVNIPNLITKTLDNWNAAPAQISLHGQRVSMAPPRPPDDAKGPAPTQMVLGSFRLGVERPNGTGTSAHLINTSQPCFFPNLVSAEVHLTEASTMSGNAVTPTTMAYHSRYLNNSPAFASNPGGIFLETTGAANQIKFSSEKAGGSLTPNLSINGYSREIGPASGNVDHLADGNFTPQEVFAGVDAKLLGGIHLQDILGLITFGDGENTDALQLTSTERTDGDPRTVTVLDWHPPIQTGGDTPDGGHIFIPTGDTDNSMDLHALIVSNHLHPAKSTSTVTGEIRDFELHLFGDRTTEFIVIPFDSLQFRAESGKKTDVQVLVSDSGVQFKGALSFVQDLADALNFAGSGLTVSTAGEAITATLTLAIPSLSVGVFGLENLAFNAAVAIPYNGDPVRFNFDFCSRESPFQLEIMIFTGGGFVGLGVGADGVELLEFSFDFGLGFSIDIGIASGQISLTGGVYFELEQDDNGGEDIDLTAYVKASGGISALGLVSVSVELYLALEYQSEGNDSQLSGDAEMSISVHIIFFGFTIGFSVHEEFAGSSSSGATPQALPAARRQQKTNAGVAPLDDTYVDPQDPAGPATHLISSMSESDWDRYCTSFALVGVGV